ncbi:YdcF family protein [Deinococcus cellulosilyticus]|uniref:DUF218 domain-containing protein n=1 Tax=Deinococcus cellulosilyticus (strain DSM 18568 / NBRC 106333 / KACC 11606 / 5516J-15) TaxID=1223518 RepID=A0A511N1X3_DEIC1|nr:YdcF family protein [Deinococcus cellulosilyticus]GEM46468.1 hypothetical protein DC3_21030 [Deinococcus cellulosilyticus NBRC 106333 = KACC 11606]
MRTHWPQVGIVTLGMMGFPHASPANISDPSPTVIVLGAAQYNGKPSPIFRSRLQHALNLYQTGRVQKVIVTGGKAEGDRYSEGEAGRNFLIQKGIPAKHVLAETRSRNTYENLKNAKGWVTTPVSVVTDSIHMPRAIAMAKDLGMEAHPSPSPLPENTSKDFLENYAARERLAYMAYILMGEKATGKK